MGVQFCMRDGLCLEVVCFFLSLSSLPAGRDTFVYWPLFHAYFFIPNTPPWTNSCSFYPSLDVQAAVTACMGGRKQEKCWCVCIQKKL